MSFQFFTNDKMALVAILTFALMFCIGAVLVYRWDREVWWIVSFELFQLMFIGYYVHQWQLGIDAVTVLPDVNLLVRPALVSLWALIVIYSSVRLWFKLRL